ncbi:MAG: hypothetical protein ACJAZ2_000559, partial [Glaciecola sp.]
AVKFAQVAEISPEVVEASKHFEHVNEKPLEDSRLQVIKDDGVSALRLSPYKYDVIISQPSNPWSAGVGNLFTKEFYRDCKLKLRPGGYVAQWFSLYEMDDKTLKLIIRTILDQFDNASVWKIGTNDILLICSESHFNFDLDKIETRYQKVQKKLSKKNVAINTFPAFLSQQFLASTDKLKKYAGQGALNTEDLPLLELWAPRSFFLDHTPTEFMTYNDWIKYGQSNLLLKKYINNNGSLSAYDKVQIALLKSNGGKGDRGNKKFKNYYNALSGDSTKSFTVKAVGQPENLFLGWLDLENIIHPIDTIHPDQKMHTWTCCANYHTNRTLKYIWTTPSKTELIYNSNYDKDWIISWTPHPANNQPLTEGKWSVKIYDENVLIHSQSFIVDKNARPLKPEHPHNKIFVASKIERVLTPLKEVNPMQNLFLSTEGLAYEKNEMVKIIWTSPSNEISKQDFEYESHYTACWIQKPGASPMEEGNWRVRVESLKGKIYLKTNFTVDLKAPLLN